jgi:cobyrinic acid a,c-diamide synthase
MDTKHAPPGLLIAAPRSGAGKTTLALGLMRAFRRRGLCVASVKCGPDYVDPAFHAVATGRSGINLDSWAMAPPLLNSLAADTANGADLILAEGAMGLFDGVPAAANRTGSSADIATAFCWPVLLVIDVSGQSQSAGAVALGCARFDARIKVAGVVLNRVGSTRHQHLAAEAIERVGLPVVGALPRSSVSLPERYLGLVQASETANLEHTLDALAEFVEAHVNVDRVFGLASPSQFGEGSQRFLPPGQRIAVARDEAFSFLYPHLSKGWRDAGAEIVFFSPLADEAPSSDCDICWLPGGYPELHAGRLANASRFREGMQRFGAAKPIHGECGGYMTLGRQIVDANGVRHQMLDLLDLVTSFEKRKLTLGYREIELVSDGALGKLGAQWRGHEFHYATISDLGADVPFAQIRDAHGSEPKPVGSRRGQITGSFFHMIAPVAPMPHQDTLAL